MGEKALTGLLLPAVWDVKFGFGVLLLFGLLLETLATTSDDLRQLCAGNIFRPNVARSQSI